ncbi:anthranilate phosphoribosyltransferase [Streptomyces sp. NPDC060085]|uniref:anthranilate phosphoribosyltransferase n=1 Tax=Streptomyces sp. NPDC060085 TaxID=3347054 RepID=UPI003656A012
MLNVIPPSADADFGKLCTWPVLLTALLKHQNLTSEETFWAMNEVMKGQAHEVNIACFMIALRAKGETVKEVNGLVDAMYAWSVPLPITGPAVDIVGTGGDQANTVNISTMAAIVAAAAGAKVVKHGNRSASSRSGSSDMLEKLDIRLDLSARRTAEIAEQIGITYCHAANFHPLMRHAAPVRSLIGVPTTFNFLGPLTNPARVAYHAIGSFDFGMAKLMAAVLALRGSQGLVFRGDDGLDELTITGKSHVWIVRCGTISEDSIDPRDLGIPISDAGSLRGGDAKENAEIARRVFAGERGPVRDAVLLNAAAGLVALNLTDDPVVEQLATGVDRAKHAIDSGAAEHTLQRWAVAAAEPC